MPTSRCRSVRPGRCTSRNTKPTRVARARRLRSRRRSPGRTHSCARTDAGRRQGADAVWAWARCDRHSGSNAPGARSTENAARQTTRRAPMACSCICVPLLAATPARWPRWRGRKLCRWIRQARRWRPAFWHAHARPRDRAASRSGLPCPRRHAWAAAPPKSHCPRLNCESAACRSRPHDVRGREAGDASFLPSRHTGRRCPRIQSGARTCPGQKPRVPARRWDWWCRRR